MGTPAGVGPLLPGDRFRARLGAIAAGLEGGSWPALRRKLADGAGAPAVHPHHSRSAPMGMVSEFKEFIAKGSVLDLAVGVVIGAAFGKIVSSLVDGIIMPLVGVLTGGVNVSDWKYVLSPAQLGMPLASETTAEVAVRRRFPAADRQLPHHRLRDLPRDPGLQPQRKPADEAPGRAAGRRAAVARDPRSRRSQFCRFS